MMLNYVLFVLTGLVVNALAGQICCPNTGCFSDDYPFNHLPLPICEDRIDPRFLVYTRDNRDTPQRMTRSSIPSVLSTSRKTFFIVHGFRTDETIEWMSNIKNALLNKGKFNVVLVGWGGGANTLNYPKAASNTRVVGAEMAALTQNLLNRGMSRGNLVCVGQSLGGHTCGHAGKRTRWGRITGLDPAGPYFENYADAARLNRRDADFVDVIHTHGQEGWIIDFGTLVPLGHADFYPNGGRIQPGCDGIKGIGLCSHARAHVYYLESIQSSCFNIRLECTNERDLPGSCSSCGSSCQTMGLDADRSRRGGKFYLEVNSQSPFCQN